MTMRHYLLLVAALVCAIPAIGSTTGEVPWAAAFVAMACIIASSLLEGQAVDNEHEVTKQAFTAENERARRELDLSTRLASEKRELTRLDNEHTARMAEISAKLSREARLAKPEGAATAHDPVVDSAILSLKDDVEKLKLALHLRQVSVPSKP